MKLARKRHGNVVLISKVKVRSAFHLSALEAIYKINHKPILCRQKEFVYSLQIFHS